MLFRIAISRLKFIEKPEEINWAELNDNFINAEVDEMRLCNAIYQGRPFCPWMNGRRKQENFNQAQHIGVDLDTGDYRSSFDALVEHPLVIQYGAIIYETPSHKPMAPKSRVVFLLDEPITSVDGYRLALEAVYSLFDGADPACVDPSRFFFGNGKLAYEQRPSGIWFSERICFPVSDLRMFAKQYLANKKKQLEQHHAELPVAEKSSSTGAVDKPSLEQVETMLAKVDPYTIDYEMWFKTIAAIKHEYGDGALSVAARWSDRAGKDPLTQNKWKSITHSHSKPATLATILKVVKEYGR